MTSTGSPGCRLSFIQRTSLGMPRFSTSSPAFCRTTERRPSAPTTSLARIAARSVSVSIRIPLTRSPSTITSTTLAGMSNRKFGYWAAFRARKFRKSHCGMKAMNRCLTGRREKSAIVTLRPPISAESFGARVCGRARNSSASPSSCITSRVDGWIVSPRKSLRKSACFSTTTTSTPARASRKPSISPAGPAPAITHVVCSSS